MAWWLEDAIKHGIVLEWQYEPKGWVLCEQGDILVTKFKSNKAKTPYTDTKTLIEEQTYTCDFRIVWNPVYEGVFFKRYDRIVKDQSPFFYAKEEAIPLETPFEREKSNLEVYQKTGFLPYTEQQFAHILVTYIDIKPGFAQASQQSFVRFPVKQAWVYDKYAVYVQKIVTLQSVKHKLGRKYSGLFVSTFVPERYLLTDSGNQRRKINFDYKTIDSYVK